MSERHLRLILAGAMFVTLLLPMNPHPDPVPNGVYILWYSMEAMPRILRSTDIAYSMGWLLPLLGLLGTLVLIPLNLCLVARPRKGVKVLYRILVLALLPLAWYTTFSTALRFRGVGLWANTAVVSAAVLLEAFFVAREQQGKQENAS